MVFRGAVADRDRGERFGHGELWYAGSKFIVLIAVPGYTCEIQRKANNEIVEYIYICISVRMYHSHDLRTAFDFSTDDKLRTASFVLQQSCVSEKYRKENFFFSYSFSKF